MLTEKGNCPDLFCSSEEAPGVGEKGNTLKKKHKGRIRNTKWNPLELRKRGGGAYY